MLAPPLDSKSSGMAFICFHNMAGALAAIKKYDTVQLDNRPMSLKLIGTPYVNKTAAMNKRLSGGIGQGQQRGRGSFRGRGNVFICEFSLQYSLYF